MENKKNYVQGTLFDTKTLLRTNNHVSIGHILANVIHYGNTFRVKWWPITGIQDEWTAMSNGTPINFMHEKWQRLTNVSAFYGNELANLLMEQYKDGGTDNLQAVKTYLLNIKKNARHEKKDR